MDLMLTTHSNKQDVFAAIRIKLLSKEFRIINEAVRPWGGFFVIADEQAGNFIDKFFPSSGKKTLLSENKLSPKILIVEAGKRLSWQYHFRRSEFWKVIRGDVGVIKSDNDIENALEVFKTGDLIELKKGERHRLVGLESWGIIAEIWQHTDKDNPSNEEDIVRLSDDFGR